jgi:hypothetical protein
MKKTLGTIRADPKTIQNMKSAVQKYNSENIFPVSEADFIRMSIELLSQLILQDKELPVKIVTK